jgi:hypothetical protein
MSELQYLPIGTQSFERIREDGLLYIDKTDLMYRLTTSGRYYFLSRPRRFGRSLLLSTLRAYFEGKKELFEGTAIAQLEKNWTKYPVLYLDMLAMNYTITDSLSNKLDYHLQNWESRYEVTHSSKTLGERLKNVIKQAAQKEGQPVVILVDEFDKPFLQTVNRMEVQDGHRRVSKDFYEGLKGMDAYIKFAFITGVTQYGKEGVFGDWNMLKDISMDNRYVTLCGFTEEEIDTVFPAYVQHLADDEEMSVTEAREKLRKYSGGYRFLNDFPSIYNSSVVMLTMEQKQFRTDIISMGTPSFLIDWIKRHSLSLEELPTNSDIESLIGFNPQSANPISILYQSGFLTIKGYDSKSQLYQLGFPNKNTEEGLAFILKQYSNRLAEDTAGFRNNYH